VKASHGLVTGSFRAPADAIFRDFDQDARLGKFGAKPVGGLAVAGRLHLGNLVFDVCVRELSRLNRLWQLVARVLVAAFGRGPRKDAFILGPSSSSSTAKISIVGSDCGQYWSARPAEPLAIGADGPWQVAGNSNQRHRATFSTKLLAFNRKTEESGFRNGLWLEGPPFRHKGGPPKLQKS
jgi:hypothetical protein